MDLCSDLWCRLQISWCSLSAVHLYFSVIGIIYLRVHTSRKKVQYNNKWLGHKMRGTISLLLCIACSLGTAGTSLRGGIPLVGACLSLLSALSSTILQLMLERRRLPAVLILLIVYWILGALGSCGHVYSLLNKSRSLNQVLLYTSAIAFFCYLYLFMNDTIVFIKEIGKSYKNREGGLDNDILENDSKSNTVYKHYEANFFSQITFYWLNSLLIRGYKNVLEDENLGMLPEEELSEEQYEGFIKIYNNANIKSDTKHTPLWKCYIKYIWVNFLIGGILKLCGDLFGLVPPVAIATILKTMTTKYDAANETPQECITFEEFYENGYILAFVIFLSSILQATFSQNSTHLINVEGIRLKACLQNLIFDKCLKIPSTAVQPKYDEVLNENHTNDRNVALITNLIAQDTYNVMSFIWIAHYVWSIPLKIFIIIYLLYKTLGSSTIIGTIISIALVVPLQFKIGKRMSQNAKEISNRNDHRLSKITETIQGMKTIKLYGWEPIFEEKILNLREVELKSLNKDSIFWGLITFITQMSTLLMMSLCFSLYYLLEYDLNFLTADRVFSALALFNQLTVPLYILPLTVPMIIEAMVSTSRLEEFLQHPNISLNILTHNENHKTKNEEMLQNEEMFDDEIESDRKEKPKILTVKNAVWKYFHENNNSVIRTEEFTIRKGKLIVIVGPSGSGKSSFLLALIGEMKLVSGEIIWNRRRSLFYCGQEPWLIRGSIRDNILLGSSWYQRRYSRCIDAAILRSDLRLLPDGDATKLGDSGSELSGGQRARVCAARALYSRSDVLVIDEPLAPLDKTTARHLIVRGLVPAVKRGRTIIMATNRLEALDYADEVILLENGQARVIGESSNLAGCEPEIVARWREAVARPAEPERIIGERRQLVRAVRRATLRRFKDEEPPMVMRVESHGSHLLAEVPAEGWFCGSVRRGGKRVLRQWSTPPAAMMRMDENRNGIRNAHILRRTLSAGTASPALTREASILMKLLRPVTRISTRQRWEKQNTTTEQTFDDITDEDIEATTEETSMMTIRVGRDDNDGISTTHLLWWYMKSGGVWCGVYCICAVTAQALTVVGDYCAGRGVGQINFLLIYCGVCACSVITSAVANASAHTTSAIARRKIHDLLLDTTLRLPLKYFDSTPLGHTLNRFSVDVTIIDKKLMSAIQRSIHFILTCSSALLVNAIIFPWLIFAAVPISFIYYAIQSLYRHTARQLQRVEAYSAGPAAGEARMWASGGACVRAAGLCYIARRRVTARLRRTLYALMLLNTLARWLGLVLDYLGAFVVLLSILTAISYSKINPDVDTTLAGLAITQAMLLPTYLAWVVKFFSDTEMYLGAVERIYEQIKSQTEDYREDDESTIRSSWPETGDIEFDNVSAGYGHGTQNVLHNITLKIPSGQKVAVCGRTGSGKSTFILCAVGAVESSSGGSVRVSGVNISKAPLHRLRRRLVVLPQEHTLHASTLRENLDPLAVHTDGEIWDALKAVHFDRFVSAQPGGIDCILHMGGNSLSYSERARACAARAVLACRAGGLGSGGALLLDEPAGSLSAAAEKALLTDICKAVAPKTVLTVTHRVSTIMEYDRVLVLSEGKIIEDDKPTILASRPDSMFARMLK